jgi:hypothetical protein
LELLGQEIEKLVTEAESRPDVDFAYSPKKASTECSSEIHATLEGLLKTAWMDYTRNKIKTRKSGVETSNAIATPSRKSALRKRPKSGGQVIRVRRKRKCPNHPEHPTMLRPTSKDKEHAILDIAFIKTRMSEDYPSVPWQTKLLSTMRFEILPPSSERLTASAPR